MLDPSPIQSNKKSKSIVVKTLRAEGYQPGSKNNKKLTTNNYPKQELRPSNLEPVNENDETESQL